MFNYFNKFITGLGLNRALFQQEAPKRAPEGTSPEVTKEMMDQTLQDYSEGKVYMAAGETDKEYAERMEKEKEDTKRKLAELEEKNTRKANAKEVKPTEVQTPFGPISVYKEGYPKWKKGRDAVSPGVKAEEGIKGQPEKTDEQVVDEVLAQAESERKAQEELARMGTGEKPKEPMTDEQMLAWLEESESAHAAKGEVAALQRKGGETMEFSEAEVALNKFQEMVNAPGADLPKVANVLSKVSEKASASLTTIGKIDEKNILSGLKGEDLAYAEIYVSLLKEVEQKHAVLLGNSPQPYEVAQVLYSNYLGDVLKKTVKNTAYLGSIFKGKIPNLTV